MNKIQFAKPVLGIAAFSGTGKTQLLTQLLPRLKQQGLRVAVIKHAHHNIDIDKPGKDSYQLRQAGATPVILASDQRIAVMLEKETPQPSSLNELLHFINPDAVDLVLIEGFKELEINKLFLFRHEIKGRFQEIDRDVSRIFNAPSTLAVVTDIDQATIQTHLKDEKPVININNIEEVTHFVLNYLNPEIHYD